MWWWAFALWCFRFVFPLLFLVCFLSVVKDLQALQVEHLFTALFRSSLVYTFQDFIYRFIQARVTTKGQKVGL